ncbi:MAG: DUF1552 domain-containing protein [Myxococcota bacterium]
MSSRKYTLSRRTFLRGVLGGTAISLGLPPLEAFFNANGTAYAVDGAFPKRFGLFFWGNGMLPDRWVPAATGPDWEATEQLAPLANLRSEITLLTGMEVKTGNPVPHGSGPPGLLTGDGPVDRNGSFGESTFPGPTIDQIMAGEIGGDTRFRSLEIGVEQGTTGLSHNGPDSINPAETNPTALFERLFGADFRAPGEEPIIDPKLSLRRSVLDAVMEDSNRLNQRLGASDRIRLEQHFSAVRDLELRIARLEEDPPNLAACIRPDAPPTELPDINGRPPMRERSRLMTDLVTMAMACDMTRVLSFWFTRPVSNVLFPTANAGHHQLTHDEPGDQPQVNQIVISIMEDLAYFLESLRSIPEGDATLLDNSIILATSDVSYARTHQINEYPLLLAGSGCGTLRKGFHYRSTTQENTSLLSFSLLRAMDVRVSEFGTGPGHVTQGLSAIEP